MKTVISWKLISGINTLISDGFQTRQLITHSEMLEIASLFKDIGKCTRQPEKNDISSIEVSN